MHRCILWKHSLSVLPGLFPAILNLASDADITTNATCGEPVSEMYCKLVEHVPGRRIRNPQCRICDASSQNPKGTVSSSSTLKHWNTLKPHFIKKPRFHVHSYLIYRYLTFSALLLTEQHPITNAIDGTNQWWQSPSIKNGRQFHWVTITLDLRQVHIKTRLKALCRSLEVNVCFSESLFLEFQSTSLRT